MSLKGVVVIGMFLFVIKRGFSTTVCNHFTMLSEKCHCSAMDDDRLILRCAHTQYNALSMDLEQVSQNFDNITLYHLEIRDSDLEELKDPFPGKVNEEIEILEFDNTKIGQIYIGNITRPLSNLKRLTIENETVSQLESNMFDGLPQLEELGVNDANMVKILPNAFVKLNLSKLHLRENHLISIPPAVMYLPYLTELDLYQNPIERVSDKEALDLQQRLKNLKKLVLTRLNCDCELATGEFYSWVRRQSIEGPQCGTPSNLRDMSITTLKLNHFCDGAPGAVASFVLVFVSSLVTLLYVFR